MASLAPLWALGRPANALLAGLGALVGALGAAGSGLAPLPTTAAVLAAAFGVGGANALNDARDAAIDRTAHPRRPIPRGDVSVGGAQAFAWTLIALALAFAAAANGWTLALACILALTLVAYEYGAKRLFLGHVLVSYAAGALFVLGGTAALAPAATYDAAALEALARDRRLLAPLVMAALAMLLNLARELFKSIEDARHDAATRPTFAVRHGAAVARRWAFGILLGLVCVAVAPWALGLFGVVYLLGLLPMLVVLAAVPFIDNARGAQRALKLAMLLGFVPFVATALI